MAELITLCREAGFQDVRTYIASGNIVFSSELSQQAVQAELEQRLTGHMGKPATLILRTMDELSALLEANPFPLAAPNHTLVTCLSAPPPADALSHITNKNAEDIILGTREIYVHDPHGIGASKLKIPVAAKGTARNINTLKKLLEIAQAIDRNFA